MRIGIVDADLIGRKYHAFPNLTCMKLSGFFKRKGAHVELLTNFENLESFDRVFIAKVFSDTPIEEEILRLPNVEYGGTGFFYDKAIPLPDAIEHCMPDYDLYHEWATTFGNANKTRYYLDYSIGFLTRGCFRHCPFCVNRNSNQSRIHSPLEEFFAARKKAIVLLDDNFLACKHWKDLLLQLQSTGKRFQFKQGLDARLLDDEKCELLFQSKYDGDFIFAFDNIDEMEIIRRKLQLIRKHTHRQCMFYILTGFDRCGKYDVKFWIQDIFDLLRRIRLLLEFDLMLPFVMRFERHKESPFAKLYAVIARWANNPSSVKKESLREFVENPKNHYRYARKYLSDFEEKYPQAAYFFNTKR